MTAPHAGPAARPWAPSRQLKLRLLSAFVLMAVGLGAVWAGGLWLTFVTAGAATVLAWEWCSKALPHAPRVPFALYALTLWSSLTLLAWTGVVDARVGPPLGVAVAGAALAAGVMLVIDRRRAVWAGMGLVYIAVPAVIFLWLREASGLVVVLGLFATVWATDTGSYVFGKWIGGPHVAPAWSPQKTWSGVIGGTIAGAIAGGATFLVFGTETGPAICRAILLALSTQIGDLMESALKRHFQAKDMGRTVPGHGGLFDRLDGFLIAALTLGVLTMTGL